MVAAAHEALDRWGTGAGGSRLVTGTRPVHAELEAALADWKGTEAAVVFPTGFAANLGVLSALGTAGGPASSPTSSTTPRSSTAAGWPGPRCRVYRHGDVDQRGVAARRSPRPGPRWW